MRKQFSTQCLITLAVATGMFGIGKHDLGIAFVLAAIAVEVMPDGPIHTWNRARGALCAVCVLAGLGMIVFG